MDNKNHSQPETNEAYSSPMSTFVRCVVITIVAITVVKLMDNAGSIQNFISNVFNKGSEPESEPAGKQDVVQDAAFNFPIGMVVLGLIGLIVLGAMVTGVVMISKKFSILRVLNSANLDGWEALARHHAKIRSEWMSYETDILKVINFPMLADMSEPVTVRFHEALQNAVLHEPKNIKSMCNIPFETSGYKTAVKELETAFRTAESKARLSSWNKFTMEEKKRLQRAKDLLAMAMNGASTPAERQSAYKQAIKTLQGLIEVPETTIAAIENSSQLALTA